jgi:hypothetical protein
MIPRRTRLPDAYQRHSAGLHERPRGGLLTRDRFGLTRGYHRHRFRPPDDLQRPCSLPGASFARLPIYGLEDLGFVPRGEAGLFIVGDNTAPGGPGIAQHEWRRPLLNAFRHVPPAGESAPDARHRPRPDPQRQDLGLPRCRRHVCRVGHNHHVERATVSQSSRCLSEKPVDGDCLSCPMGKRHTDPEFGLSPCSRPHGSQYCHLGTPNCRRPSCRKHRLFPCCYRPGECP